jgi:hypothetical protein
MRALPPSFLLPSWGARQLALNLQRACMSDSASGKPVNIRKVRPTRSKQSKSPRSSLFDELFPEEKDSEKDGKESKVDKLPPFQFDHGFERNWGRIRQRRPTCVGNWKIEKGDDAEEAPPPTPQSEQEGEKRRREAAVLVLNSASKRLEESDFFRIGHKGTHIQGWTTGIIKGTDCICYRLCSKSFWF